MSIYVVSDIHSTYTKFLKNIPKDASKIIINGDLFNKGTEQKEMLLWLYDNYDNDKYVFVIGNHDLILFTHMISHYKPRLRTKFVDDIIENTLASYKHYNIVNIALDLIDKNIVDLDQLINKILPVFKWYHKEVIGNRTYYISHASWDPFKSENSQNKRNLVYDTSLLINEVSKKESRIDKYVEYCKQNNITHIFGHFVCDKVFGKDAPVVMKDVFVYIDNGVFRTSKDYVFLKIS